MHFDFDLSVVKELNFGGIHYMEFGHWWGLEKSIYDIITFAWLVFNVKIEAQQFIGPFDI